jgi:uncharacterized protein (DUF1778 family)
MKTLEKARFDTKLPKEQKEFFEYAASIGGYRSLSEFIISSAINQARKIIDEHDKILASKKDREIFFNALMNPDKPNAELKNAYKLYQEIFG